MARLNLGVVVGKDKALTENLDAIIALIKNAIPDQGAQINVTIIPLPAATEKVTLDKLFPKVFKPKDVGVQ